MSAAPDLSRYEREHRTLPHNLDLEASILGGVILDNSVLARLEVIEADHFYDMRHKVVWQAIRNLEAKLQPIDPTTLGAEIERHGKLESVGGYAFLGELVLKVPTPDNVVAYARTLRDQHLLRQIAERTSEALQRSYEWRYEPDELLGETIVALQQLERGYRAASEKIPFISVGQALEDLEQLARSPIYETPFAALNRAIGFGGMLGGQIYYVAAGTGIGKTTWVGAVAQHYGSVGGEVLVATWEMLAGYFVARIAAGPLQCHSNDIIRGSVSGRDVIENVSPRILFLEKPSLDVLKRAAKEMTARARRAPLVVVDYIQLLAELVASTMNRPDLRQATSIASGVLRDIARELGCPVLVVSGAGRMATRKIAAGVRKLHPAELVDVAKESGAIEFDGAGVIVLSLSEDYDGDEQIATMTLAKARFGEKCHIDMRYNGSSGTWREIGRVERAPQAETPPPPQESSSELQTRILYFLRDHVAKHKTDLCARVTGNKKQLGRAYDQLLSDGKLEVTKGLGVTLSEKGRQTQIEGV